MPTIIRKKAAIIRRAVRVNISIPYIYSLPLKNIMSVEDPLIRLKEGEKSRYPRRLGIGLYISAEKRLM
jgi:hypothetical protein